MSSTFQNNLFTNIHQFDIPGQGTGVVATWGSTGTGTPLDAISFTGNTFSHLTDTDGMPAMNLNTVTGTVSGNTFQDIHQYGILLAGVLSNLSITGNLFDSIHNDTVSTSQNRGSGIRTFQQPTFGGPVSVTGNTFSNDYHGVRVANDGSPANLPAGDFLVNRNAFTTDASDGISLDPATTGTINGTCNWWGAASGPSNAGPGSGTGVTAGATFNPWLITSNLNGACVAAPTITEVFDGSNSSAAPTALGVAFTPGPDGGNPFTSFTATCSSLNGGPTATASGPGSPIFVGGLAATGSYQCTVTAAKFLRLQRALGAVHGVPRWSGELPDRSHGPDGALERPGQQLGDRQLGAILRMCRRLRRDDVRQRRRAGRSLEADTGPRHDHRDEGADQRRRVPVHSCRRERVGDRTGVVAHRADHGGRARGSHRDARGAGREGIGQAHVHDPVGQWRADHELHRKLRVDQPGRDEVEDRQSEPAHRVGAHRRQGVHVHGQGDEQPGNRTFFASIGGHQGVSIGLVI